MSERFDRGWREVTLCCSEHERLWACMYDVIEAAYAVAESRGGRKRLFEALAALEKEATDE